MTLETPQLSRLSRAVPSSRGTRPKVSHNNPLSRLSRGVPPSPETAPDLHKHPHSQVSHTNPPWDTKSRHVSAGQKVSHPVPYYVGGRVTPHAATHLRPVGPPLSHGLAQQERP